MKQTKTIIYDRRMNFDFDDAVNMALSTGWILVSRFISPGIDTANRCYYPVLVAYLEREVSHEEV